MEELVDDYSDVARWDPEHGVWIARVTTFHIQARWISVTEWVESQVRAAANLSGPPAPVRVIPKGTTQLTFEMGQWGYPNPGDWFAHMAVQVWDKGDGTLRVNTACYFPLNCAEEYRALLAGIQATWRIEPDGEQATLAAREPRQRSRGGQSRYPEDEVVRGNTMDTIYPPLHITIDEFCERVRSFIESHSPDDFGITEWGVLPELSRYAVGVGGTERAVIHCVPYRRHPTRQEQRHPIGPYGDAVRFTVVRIDGQLFVTATATSEWEEYGRVCVQSAGREAPARVPIPDWRAELKRIDDELSEIAPSVGKSDRARYLSKAQKTRIKDAWKAAGSEVNWVLFEQAVETIIGFVPQQRTVNDW